MQASLGLKGAISLSSRQPTVKGQPEEAISMIVGSIVNAIRSHRQTERGLSRLACFDARLKINAELGWTDPREIKAPGPKFLSFSRLETKTHSSVRPSVWEAGRYCQRFEHVKEIKSPKGERRRDITRISTRVLCLEWPVARHKLEKPGHKEGYF